MAPVTRNPRGTAAQRYSQYNVEILIAGNSRHHTWSYQLSSIAGDSMRGASLGPREATAHSLLAIALISALRAISGRRLATIKQRNGGKIPTVRVLTDNAAFAQGLQKFITGQQPEKFRAGRSFWRELKQRTSPERFVVSVEVVKEDDARIPILASWGKQHVIQSPDVMHVPAVFLPSALALQR
jgi:hypothetical protein